MRRIVTTKGKMIPFPESAITQTPYPEATPKLNVVWEESAIESLQSLERYTTLKAIDEGKRFVKKVMEVAAKDAGENQTVMKFHVQNAIATVLDENEKSKQQTDKPSSL